MISALIALAFIQSTSFFPLQFGTRYVYEETGQAKMVTEDLVGEEITIKGLACIPVVTSTDGKVLQTSIYRVEDGVLFYVGDDVKAPLPKPIPIAKVPAGTSTVAWEFQGPATTGKKAEELHMRGEAKIIGKRKVAGQIVDILEVKTRSQTGDVVPLLTEQTILYARGIGMIEVKTMSRIGKKPVNSKITLKEYLPPQAGVAH